MKAIRDVEIDEPDRDRIGEVDGGLERRRGENKEGQKLHPRPNLFQQIRREDRGNPLRIRRVRLRTEERDVIMHVGMEGRRQ